ncbi:hypothetical protein OROHE_009242 [Orobanche hederae]
MNATAELKVEVTDRRELPRLKPGQQQLEATTSITGSKDPSSTKSASKRCNLSSAPSSALALKFRFSNIISEDASTSGAGEVSIRIIAAGDEQEEEDHVGTTHNDSLSRSISRSESAASALESQFDLRRDHRDSSSSSDHRYDIQQAARWIEQGFCVTICIAGFMFKSNDILRKQTALKAERIIFVLIGISFLFTLPVFGIYWWYRNYDLLYPLLMLPPKAIPPFWHAIFIIMVNDTLVRQAEMVFKCMLLIYYRNSRGRNYRRQGQMLTLVEYLLLLYRALLPAPVWFHFFLNKEYGSLFSPLMTGLYLTFKLTSVVEKVQSLITALKALSQKDIHYGAYATPEQASTFGCQVICTCCSWKNLEYEEKTGARENVSRLFVSIYTMSELHHAKTLSSAEYMKMFTESDDIAKDPVLKEATYTMVGKKTISAVRNQGRCCSCYSCVSCDQISSVYLHDHPEEGVLPVLAPQHQVDCMPNHRVEKDGVGCKVATYKEAFRFARDTGIYEEQVYRYEGRKGPCRCHLAFSREDLPQMIKSKKCCSKPKKRRMRITDFKNLTPERYHEIPGILEDDIPLSASMVFCPELKLHVGSVSNI